MILIYLIGLIISYFLGRYNLRKFLGEDYNWASVWCISFISIFSVFGIMVWIIVILIDVIQCPEIHRKVPKWM